jgi:ferredoxin-type protein NapG
MKRRDFFKLGARKTAKAVLQVAAEKTALLTGNWIRPPYAIAERAFLAACTQCDKCIEACPHDVLFRLPEKKGSAAGTPAMDLLIRGCHMCEDWPCVEVCEPDALVRPEADTGPLRMATVRINETTCLPYSGPECGACAASCPVPGALTWQGGLKPVIDAEHCTGCALCREACITDPKSVEVAVYFPEETPD